MFGQTKPAASLSSGLLARKGHARPAMRPQGFVGASHTHNASVDDLGWNDMGEDYSAHYHQQLPEPQPQVPSVLRQREVLDEQFSDYEPQAPVGFQPAAYDDEAGEEEEGEEEVAAFDPPPMTIRRPAIAEVPQPVAAAPAAATLGSAAVKRIEREVGARKTKAAFTLRLDSARHLQLRLASAVRNMSAQQLVTEALDRFLESLPEVSEMARQFPSGKGRE